LENLERLEKYLVELSTNSSLYFDFGVIRHVISNSDLLVSFKKSPHRNIIIIVKGESHHVVGEGNMIAKFKIKEIKHKFKFFHVLKILKKNLLLVGAIVNFGSNVKFLPNKCLVRNMIMRAIVLKCTKVNGKGLYNLEARVFSWYNLHNWNYR
jgi:hypothetical protein